MHESQPFAIQAAKASWVAPLLATALSFSVKTMLRGDTRIDPQTNQIVWIVVGVIVILIVASGLILGVAALFGLKKHGWRGILIPSLVGIVLCSGYLYLLVSAVLLVRRLAEERGIS